MSQYYELAFSELHQEIGLYSPSAVLMLEQLKDACGAQTAYYAAFVIVCLKAQQGLATPKPLDSMTSADFKDFTFFEVAKDNQSAITLFEQMLTSYRVDQTSVSP